MGLDVSLVQFTNVDTEAILKFSQASSEPGAGVKLKTIARALGLPESIIGAYYYGGTKISYPSKKHGAWPQVGDWSSFASTRELIEHFTGKDFYFIFPEAEGNPEYLRPDWAASRKRLVDILEQLQKLTLPSIEGFRAQFITPNVPQNYLEKVPPSKLATTTQLVDSYVAQVEVMIETLDYVLNHERPHEFLLRWSA
jgi:hypothetical protein